MKRLLVLSSLSLLLAACGPTDPLPANLTDQAIQLGQTTSKAVSQDFNGEWRISNIPSWLSVSTYSGKGPVNLTVTARRSLVTPVAADQKSLTGDIAVTWSSGTQAGTAHWKVTADQYLLTGRAATAATLSAKDIQASPTVVSPVAQEVASSVIVTYRSTATRNAVLQAGNIKSQNVGEAASRSTLQNLQIPVAERDPLTDKAVLLRVPATPEVLSALKADPNVQSVTPSARMSALSTGGAPQTASTSAQALPKPVVPTDEYAPLQWAYQMLGYGAVWRDIESGGYTKPVTVAVIDTGVRYDHPDLAGKLYLPSEGALDVIESPLNGDGDGVDNDPTDPKAAGRTGSHGTHVTGIIAANWGTFTAPCAGCSTSGVVGATYTAPVKVLPVRAIDVYGNTYSPEVINAVRYAAGLPVTIKGKTFVNPHPAQVINMSLGGPMSAAEAQPICDAVAEAAAQGSLIFAAAGNDGQTDPFYPAACPGAVSVGSVSLSGASAPMHAVYSQAYPQVQLSAPGGTGCPLKVSVPCSVTYFNGNSFNGSPFPDYILSTSWDYAKNQPSYGAEAGTSQAAPQVSALAALMLSKGVTSGASDTLSRLIATATDLGAAGRDPLFGYGMINPAAALNAPAVSSGFGLRLQDAEGHSYQPALDNLGRFEAYLGDGTYQVTAGYDLNGNGIYGEVGEPSVSKQVQLGPSQPTVDVGLLTPQ